MSELRKYGESQTVTFSLFQIDGVDFEPAAVFAAGDIKIMKDEGVEADTTNLPTDEGQGYSIILTATEMQAARIKLYIVDQTATKIWLDMSLSIETYGHASAQHAFDLDTASVAQTGDGYARLGAPAGVSVSADVAAVKTDSSAILTDTNELQVDWTNGGRLDLLLDQIITDIAALNNISAADVNTQVDDVLNVATLAEVAAVPAANAAVGAKINWLFALSRNKGTQISTTKTLRNDADTADIATSTVSSDGTTFTRGEYS